MTGGGLRSGARLHITRARLCWCSGASTWMAGTHSDQRRMKGVNVGVQLERESCCRGVLWSLRRCWNCQWCGGVRRADWPCSVELRGRDIERALGGVGSWDVGRCREVTVEEGRVG